MREKNCYKYPFILPVFLMLCISPLFSQEYSYQQYTVRDGLPQNQIMDLMQDSQGYIWVATKGGVSRFDGHSFKNYTRNNGLLANHVIRTVEDKKGRINFLTYLGMSRLEGDTIVTVYHTDSISARAKMFFVKTHEGTEWWIQEGDVFNIYSGRELIGVFEIPDEFKQENIIAIAKEETAGKLWISLESGGLFSFTNGKTQEFESPENTRVVELSDDRVLGINTLNVYEIDTLNKQLKIITRSSGTNLGRMVSSKNGNVYTAINIEEINIWDGEKNSLLAKRFNYINDLLADEESNLWIATETGLYRLISTAFENYLPGSGCPEYTWSIVEDNKGCVWFASYGDGLSCFKDGNFSTVSEYRDIYNYFDGTYFYTGANQFSNGDIYFPVKNAGILRFDGDKFSLLEGIPTGSCMDVMEDIVQNKVICASTAGLVIYESPDDVVHIQSDYWETKKFIKTLAIDKLGRYWLGGEYLLQIYDGESFIDFPNEENDYSAGAISIYKDYKDNLWLGTTSGLYFYDYKTFKSIAPKVLNSQVASFALEKDKNLIMGISGGMAILDLAGFYEGGAEDVKVIGAARGFLGFDCIRNGILYDSEESIWIAASDRVIRYYPTRMELDISAPEIVIEEMIFTTPDASGGLTYGNPYIGDQILQIPSRYKNLRIDYHAIHFNAPDYITYKYRLTGYDASWSEETKDRFVSYTNLEPGAYTFEVLACNIDGVWSPVSEMANFEIVPTFYQTLPFRLLVNFLILLVTLGLSLYIYNYFHKRKQARLESERKITELQLKTIKSQMDPHFTFNALNSISSVIYKENREKAYRYFTRFSRLIRSSLEVSDKISRSLKDEIEFTQDYLELEKVRFSDDFIYELQIDKAIELRMQVPKMIIQNYAENAVKHGLKHKIADRRLWIHLIKESDALLIIVRDNGVGRKQAKKKKGSSTGKGLKIMNSIYNLYYTLYKIKIQHEIRDLEDDQGKPTGTEIIINIPLATL